MTSLVSEFHGPLADGHIRLLELNLEHEHDIVGHLQAVKCTSAPAYYALSYVCGNGPYEREVTINDAPFKVRPNLYAALRRLQSYFRSDGTPRVSIWIDAICINQDNADEKARQIQGMHDIFSKAKEVLVALGPVSQNVHMVLSIFSWIGIYTAWDFDPLKTSKNLKRLEQGQGYDRRKASVGHAHLQLARDIERLKYVTQQLKTRHKVDVPSLIAIKTLLGRLKLFGIWVPGDKPLTNMASTDFDENLKLAIDLPSLTGQLFHPNHPFWAGVYALSEIEWYQRVWTYQEVALARNAKVLAEDLSVDWDDVVDPTIGLLQAMAGNEMFRKIDAEAIIVGLPTAYLRNTWSLKWLSVGKSGNEIQENGLIFNLVTTRSRKSTIAKDKVYGLLGVLTSDERAQIPIDYTNTDGEVFASAVKAGLEFENADMIPKMWDFFDETPAAMEDLPSWCPNFASMSGPLHPVKHYPISLAVQQQFKEFACYERSLGFRTIRVKVLRLDRTVGCVDIACPLDDTRSQFSLPSDVEASHALEAALEHWLVQIRAAFSDDDSAPGLPLDVIEFLYRTSEHRLSLSGETFWKTLNHMLSFIDSGRQPPRAYESLRDSAEYGHTLTILSSQSGRYLFKTTSGKFGFSTWQSTPGGHIFLLPGSARMHMLTNDCTQYLGCASLPSVTVDDLSNLVNARKNMWEMVELR